MDLKESVLEILSLARSGAEAANEAYRQALAGVRDGYTSGEALADALGVSRNAIWKAVKGLLADGFAIGAIKNRGYRLEEDVLTACGIVGYLGEAAREAYKIEVLSEATSTNAIAKRRAADGAAEFSVVAARAQTTGRGRLDRQFFSPRGSGTYFTVTVRPRRELRKATTLTVLAAVAVAEGLERAGSPPASIKWVNDVYVGGKKCTGILTEAVSDMESGGVEYAVVGIGIDVQTPPGGFPPALEGVASAALDGVKDGLNRATGEVLDRFFALYTQFDREDIVSRYRARSFLTGRSVMVCSANEEYEAIVLDIDDECRLVARREDGRVERLGAGEVRLVC